MTKFKPIEQRDSDLYPFTVKLKYHYKKEINALLTAFGEEPAYPRIPDKQLDTLARWCKEQRVNPATYMIAQFRVGTDDPGRQEIYLPPFYELLKPEAKAKYMRYVETRDKVIGNRINSSKNIFKRNRQEAEEMGITDDLAQTQYALRKTTTLLPYQRARVMDAAGLSHTKEFEAFLPTAMEDYLENKNVYDKCFNVIPEWVKSYLRNTSILLLY
jgi:hypothetical protein